MAADSRALRSLAELDAALDGLNDGKPADLVTPLPPPIAIYGRVHDAMHYISVLFEVVVYFRVYADVCNSDDVTQQRYRWEHWHVGWWK